MLFALHVIDVCCVELSESGVQCGEFFVLVVCEEEQSFDEAFCGSVIEVPE